MKNEKSMENESSSDGDSSSSSEDERDISEKKEGKRDLVKRHAEWCNLEGENNVDGPSNDFDGPSYENLERNSRRATWHLPSSSSHRHSEATFGNLWEEPTLFGNKMQLYCKTGHHLAIYPDGRVRGTPDENDMHTYLELISAGYPGHVRIKGMLTNLFLAMNLRGRLYAEMDAMEEAGVFIESFQGSYNSYLSRKYAHLGWYVGMKKSGRIKKGPLTAYGQNAVRFLPRRSRFH